MKSTAEGSTTMPSNFGPKNMMDWFETEIRARGISIFARIEHTAGATEVGLALGPAELIIFGNARAGAPLVQANQTIGIDLLLKALAWQHASSKTWLSYKEPSRLTKRYDVGAETDHIVETIAPGLSAVSRTVTEPA